MYADSITDPWHKAIDETNRRRAKQIAYNEERGVDPQPLQARTLADLITGKMQTPRSFWAAQGGCPRGRSEPTCVHVQSSPSQTPVDSDGLPKEDFADLITRLTEQMHTAAGGAPV